MKTIRIYRGDGTGETITARGQTLESAIINAGRRIGQLGLCWNREYTAF